MPSWLPPPRSPWTPRRSSSCRRCTTYVRRGAVVFLVVRRERVLDCLHVCAWRAGEDVGRAGCVCMETQSDRLTCSQFSARAVWRA